MKAIETVLHLRRAHPRKMKTMVPDHVWRLVAPYGLAPGESERKEDMASQIDREFRPLTCSSRRRRLGA